MAVSAPEAAYESLRALIVRGALAPGARLVELELASRLGVSRTPVREALRRLVAEGFVHDPSAGRYARLTVAPLTADDGRELFEVVGALEGVAARAAAGVPDAPRAVLATELRALNRDLRRASESAHPDHEALLRLDDAFHRRIVAAGGARVRALHAAVKPQAERYERLYVSYLGDSLEQSIDEHRRIVRAIRDGDAAEAEGAAMANWRNAASRLARVVARAGARGAW